MANFYENMNLNDTVDMMNSEDYKERFKAEYLQTKIRCEKLKAMLVKMEAKTLDFTPECDLIVLKRQQTAMEQYLHVMEVRAEMEGIEI